MKLTSLGLSTLGVLALCAQASAQNVNVDVDGAFGVPANTFAAAGTAGTWNLVPAGVATPMALVDTTGAATGVTISSVGGAGAYNFNNGSTSGDDQALMDDLQDVGGAGGTATWTISGLAAGTYTVRTYAWAPDDSTYRTGVAVNGGMPASVGGAWPAGYAVGVTHAVDTVTITAGGTITVVLSTVVGFASFDGLQIQQAGPPPSPFTVYCSGDGTGTACPCGNSGSAGNGCATSLSTSGAHVGGTGNPSVSADTMVLNGSNMPNSSALYFQGTVQIASGAGALFGDGLRCAGGSVIRLGTKTNALGASQFPAGGDPAVHVKGNCVAGDTRSYQIWFRNADPTFCTPSTFNLTNGLSTTWVP